MTEENILNSTSLSRALRLALIETKRGRTETARVIYRDILERFPKNLKAIQGFNGLQCTSGSPDSLMLDPPEDQLEHLVSLYSQGQLDQALEYANQLVATFSNSASLHNICGVVQTGLQQYEHAVESYQNALEIQPDSSEMYNNLGNALQYLGNLDGAVESYRRALEIQPDFAEAHNNFGNALQELSCLLQEKAMLKEAETSYRKAIELKNDYAEAYSNLGNVLLELNSLEEAELFCRRAIALKPNFAEAHSNLGNVLQDLGRLEEAEASYKQVIALKPDFAAAHSNLGNALKELGRLEEAENSYLQAIVLKPDFAEAHNNLGVTLTNLGRLEDAENSYRQSILLNFDYAEARNNLGYLLETLGRLEEAENSYVQAIVLKPDFAEAHNNLGVTLQKLGRLAEAEDSYRQAIALKWDYAKAIMNLSVILAYASDAKEAMQRSEDVIRIDSENTGLRAGVNLAIFKFLENDFIASKHYLSASSGIQEKVSLEYKNENIYWRYLHSILEWHHSESVGLIDSVPHQKLYVIGESHALVSHALRIEYLERDFLCESLLIKGCKQWHLGNYKRNQYKNKFESALRSIPKSSEILLVIGEIDCRLDNGILQHKAKFPKEDLKEIILDTVANYLSYVAKINVSCMHNIIIQGVPCPNLGTKITLKEEEEEEEVVGLVEVIRIFNSLLKAKAGQKGFKFLDVHKFTDRGDGISNGTWHIDDYHLSPEGMITAWREHSIHK